MAWQVRSYLLTFIQCFLKCILVSYQMSETFMIETLLSFFIVSDTDFFAFLLLFGGNVNFDFCHNIY